MKLFVNQVLEMLLAAAAICLSPDVAMAQTDGGQLSYNDSRRFYYFFNESLVQSEKGNYAAAFDLMRHARDINPQSAAAYYELSQYYVDLHNDTLSRRCQEMAARLQPNNSYYLERLAQLYITQHDYPRAINAYERLCKAGQEREDVLQIMLSLYASQNNYARMIDVLNRLEILQGSSEQISLTKMQIYEQQGRKDKELAELRRLVAKNPFDLNYRVMMGNWLLQNGNADKALKEYRAVLKEEPDNTAAQMSMLDYYRAKNQTANADRLLHQLLVSKKTSKESKITLLRQEVMESDKAGGDSARIMGLIDLALSQPQVDGSLYMFKAAYMNLKKMPVEQINDVYTQVLAVEPENVSARYQLISYWWNKNDYDRVIALCKPAEEYAPQEMIFYYFQGMAQYQKDDADGTLATFRKGVAQINDKSNSDMAAELYLIMGDILHSKGMDEESYQSYDSCLQWKPDNLPCLNNYAYNLSLEGKQLEKAEQMSFRCVKEEPTNSTFLDTYAWVLFRQGRFDEARIYIDKAIENDSAVSSVELEHAGDIYARCGDTDAALRYWQQALGKGSGSAMLKRKIELKKYVENE